MSNETQVDGSQASITATVDSMGEQADGLIDRLVVLTERTIGPQDRPVEAVPGPEKSLDNSLGSLTWQLQRKMVRITELVCGLEGI